MDTTDTDAPALPAILERLGRVEQACRIHAVTLGQAALAFPQRRKEDAALVRGAATAAELPANVADAAVPVPAWLWSDLRVEGRVDPHASTG